MTAKLACPGNPLQISTVAQLDAHLDVASGAREDACYRIERWLRTSRSISRAAMQLQAFVAQDCIAELGWHAAEEWIKARIAAGEVLVPEGVS